MYVSSIRRPQNACVSKVWNAVGGFLLVTAAALLCVAASGLVRLRPAANYEDRGGKAFYPYPVLPVQVKNRTSYARDQSSPNLCKPPKWYKYRSTTMEVCMMGTRRKRSPEEQVRRVKIRELLQESSISSMADIQKLFKATIAEFMETGLEAELDEELGYSRYDYKNKETENSQNGHRSGNIGLWSRFTQSWTPHHYHVRSEEQIVKKAVYIATGINLDGRKDVGWGK